MKDTCVYGHGEETDRRCEALASVVRDMQGFMPIRFREREGSNGQAWWKLRTKKIVGRERADGDTGAEDL